MSELFQHGDSAVYWAARQGHVEVIKYLYDEGIPLDTQNKVNIMQYYDKYEISRVTKLSEYI
jgi:hypothetical protein